MRILLANDDGIFSQGLEVMANVLRQFGELCIAAPATEQSGVGPGITFLTPLTVKKAYRRGQFWGYAVEGTPVDCVKMGIAELAGWRPDLVVSGINNGLNIGINVLYSGTVAAAQEAAWQGIPAIAVSTQYSDKTLGAPLGLAAEIAGKLIQKLITFPQKPNTLYNINIPFAALKEGADRTPAVVPVDMTPHWCTYEKRFDPTNRGYYWISDRPNPNPACSDNSASDMDAVAAGKIAVSPISVNPTDQNLLLEMKKWVIEPISEPSLPEPTDSITPDFQLIRWMEDR